MEVFGTMNFKKELDRTTLNVISLSSSISMDLKIKKNDES